MSDRDRLFPSRLVRRALTHPAAGATLSPELEREAARRLGALTLVVAIVDALLRLVSQLGHTSPSLGVPARIGLVLLDIVMSLALFAAIERGWLSARHALALGVPYEVAHGLLSSITFHALTLAPGAGVVGWTPVAVWAIVYPLIVPSRPAQVWIATLATTLMDPLGLAVNFAIGAPMPSLSNLLQLLFPSAVACLVSPVAARIVYDLTLEANQAREMGAYRLVEKLGEGGMGEVWRAQHRILARAAAVKLIRPSRLGGDSTRARQIVKRFEREAQATTALRSPHTVAVYDYGIAADGTFYSVMELLEGFNLQVLVERFGPVPPERAVRLLRQACLSLAEAHAAGLVHRDIKPANMFLCRLGLEVDFVKVLDFGIVKVQAAPSGAPALTAAGEIAGTPAFMPPEIVLGTKPVDGRADIYALGAVAYWLLTGHHVFEGSSATQIIVDHVSTPPVPPSRRTAQPIPEGLERIVLRCLEKEPCTRPYARELSSALAALGLEERWSEERAREWWRDHASARDVPARSVLAPHPGSEEMLSASDWLVSETPVRSLFTADR